MHPQLQIIENIIREHLVKVNGYLNVVSSPKDKRHLELYIHDLEYFCTLLQKNHSKKLDTPFIFSWSVAIFTRIKFYYEISTQLTDFFISCYHDEIFTKFLKKYEETPIQSVLFSQQTCNSRFAVHVSTEKLKFPFFGQSIREVAECLKSNLSTIDEIAIKVFKLHFKNGSYWVAINNRGLATLALSTLAPVRFIPTHPTDAELKRLKEIFSDPSSASMNQLRSITLKDDDADEILMPTKLPS